MESNFKLGLLDLPDNFYCKLNKPYLQKIKKVIKKNYGKEEILRREIKTLFKEDISRTTLSTFLKGSTFLSLKRLKIFQSIFDLTALEKNVISIKSSKSGLPISIKLPLKQSKTLARLIGHLLGDGGIFDYSIYYFNKNETLINQFEKDSYEVFGKFKIEKITNLDGTTRLRLPKITGKILSLEKINFSRGKIPNFILKGSREIKAAFLRAIFDDEGSITNNEISIEMTNKNLIYTTATFLKEFEIEIKTIGSRKRDVYKRSYYYGIYGKADLIKFHKQIGFNHPIKDKKLFRKINNYKINQRKNNEARKEIMALLSQGELKTRDLLNVLKIKSPCLSFHMKKLIKKDFVERIPGKIDRDNKGKIVNIYEDSWKLR